MAVISQSLCFLPITAFQILSYLGQHFLNLIVETPVCVDITFQEAWKIFRLTLGNCSSSEDVFHTTVR